MASSPAGSALVVRRTLSRRLEHAEPAPWASTLALRGDRATASCVGFTDPLPLRSIRNGAVRGRRRGDVDRHRVRAGSALSRLLGRHPAGAHLLRAERAEVRLARDAAPARAVRPRSTRPTATSLRHSGKGDRPTTGALHSATGDEPGRPRSAASRRSRETRLVAAETTLPDDALAPVGRRRSVRPASLIFVQTLGANTGDPGAPRRRCLRSFTAVMILLVFALNQPYSDGGGAVKPRLIEETTATMVSAAPDLARLPCPVGK